MPTYDYRCTCGYREEVTHGIADDPIIECSYCLIPLVRKPGVRSVTFDSSGWGKD